MTREDDLISRRIIKEQMLKYGFTAPDMTITEFVEDCLPSAQPEIIHCESCKHWKNEHICECLSRYGTFETPKNFYCGYGKEK